MVGGSDRGHLIAVLGGEALPDPPQSPPVGGRSRVEEGAAKHIIVSSSSLPENSGALGREDREPLAAVGRIDLSAHSPIAFKSRHEVRRACGAQHHTICEYRHSEALVRCVEECDQYVELGDCKAMVAAQLGIESLHDSAVQHHERSPRLPFFACEKFVAVAMVP